MQVNSSDQDLEYSVNEFQEYQLSNVDVVSSLSAIFSVPW